MRILKTAVLLAAFAAGAAAQEQRPLEASLRRGVSEASFYVDQPAYVAVFEVIPGQGIQQVFPRSSSQASSPVQPGEYLLSRPFRSQYGYYGWNNSMPYARPMYMVDHRGRIVSYFYTTGWTGSPTGWDPTGMMPARTLLMVASRSPLRRVGTPDAAHHWLQQVVGFRAISSTVYAPSSMLTDIVDAILPVGASVDDIVVDVLEITDYYNSASRWSGQSIAFYCPTGVYRIPAEFFFGTGVYYCPQPMPGDGQNQTQTTPPSLPGGDSVKVEQLQLPARKVPPKYEVEESAVQYRRGIVTTPVTPQLQEEGYRPFRGGGREAEEGLKAFGRGVWTSDVGPRATIQVGVPVDPIGMRRGDGNPAAEAFVPRSVRSVPTEPGSYGARYSGGGHSPGSSGSSHGSSSGTSSSGSSGSSTAGSGSSAPSPSTAQAERSAASREAVSAARPAATTTVPPRDP